jgi:CcmD family protein
MMNTKWMRPIGRLCVALVIGLFAVGLVAGASVAAQVPGAAGLREMRHFWHVFIAYAIAWILIFGWLFSIVKRLRIVEERLKD